MSVTNAGPPTAPNTRCLPPKMRFRSGFRAKSSNVEGALETSSMTCSGSSRTRAAAPRPAASASRFATAPAPSNRSIARPPRTSTPTSRRIRRPALWIISTWSALRISTGASGFTIRCQGSLGIPPLTRRSRRGRARRSSGLSGTTVTIRGSNWSGRTYDAPPAPEPLRWIGGAPMVDRTNPTAAGPRILRSLAHVLAGDDALLPDEGGLASFDGAVGWRNSEPLTPQGLRGRVVLVDFWTYTCVNWLRTAPYVRAWDDRYRKHGLTVIGAHTPEFGFEHDVTNVDRALGRFDV